ncbi:MAG: flavin reductase family protein [Clostridiales bacterium]|nr:flavin reductase family protein [Clostridiales bacterium]MDO4349864.1 flavin reductase family protein [Eubacteriales bacterium]MDY4007634.1 flavin reductase family protein [Candidatus Limiplasma sp.]
MEQTTSFRTIGPTTYLCPIPAVMLGCAAPEGGEPNLITVAWTGVVCSKPPMLSVSIRKERLSHDLIARSGEFTLNLVSRGLCRAMDYCGVKSGREVRKFAQLGLDAIPAPGLAHAPAVKQAPAFLSCKVHSIQELGSHDLFLADIVQVSVQDRYFLADGSIDESAMQLVSYVHGKYHALGGALGFFGYSVASPKALERRMKKG